MVVYVPFDPVFCVFNYQEAVRLARTPDLRNRPVETFLGFESVKINPNGTGSAMDLQLMLAERIEFNLISWIYEPAEPGVTSDARLRVAFVSSLNDFVLNGQLDYTTLMNSYSKLSFFNLKRR